MEERLHMTSISLPGLPKKEDLVGDPGYLGRYDLLSVIIIGLSKELAEETDGIGLHRLLGALFSTCLSAEEFQIPMDTDMERRINFMCNLDEGIAEDAIEHGWKKGQKRYRTGYGKTNCQLSKE